MQIKEIMAKLERLIRRTFLPESEFRWREIQRRLDCLEGLARINFDIRNIHPAFGDLRLLQLANLALLKEIAELFKQNNITYWISSGNLIGAVRHRGYIPWDDDIDICVLRDDHNRISELIEQTYGCNGDIFCIKSDCIRVHKRGTPCQIDIFAWDVVSLPDYSEQTLDKLEKVYRLNNSQIHYDWGRLFHYERTIIDKSNDEVLALAQDVVSRFSGPCKLLVEGVEESHRNFFHWKYETVFPLKEIEYEGDLFPCPNDVDTYLREIYGDYMEFPKTIMLHSNIINGITEKSREVLKEMVFQQV